MAAISSLGIGSGLDLNGLLDQLKSAEREKLAPITQQRQSYQSKISAYGKLEGALEKFQSATAKLNDASLFNSVKSSVSGGEGLKVAAGAGAAQGTYAITVNHKAQAHSMTFNGVADKTEDLGATAFSITVGGEDINVSLEDGASSLEDIRDAINAQEGGVRASIINDGTDATPYRLSLTSTETGEDAAITKVAADNTAYAGLFEFEEGGEEEDTGTVQQVEAKNASLDINNVAIESQGNQIDDVIEGLTLDLEEDSGSFTVAIERDNEAITSAIKDFVSAYNSLKTSMDGLTSYNAETGQAGQLLGDATMRGIESRLRSVMSGAAGEGDFTMLSDIGISLDLKGKLEVDDEALADAVSNNLSDLQSFFADETAGFSGKVDETLEQMLRDKGTLENATSGLETSLDTLQQRYERMEKSIESTISRYRTQFSQLDSMIAEMNSTSGYLAQQFDMMNAQLGRN